MANNTIKFSWLDAL